MYKLYFTVVLNSDLGGPQTTREPEGAERTGERNEHRDVRTLVNGELLFFQRLAGSILPEVAHGRVELLGHARDGAQNFDPPKRTRGNIKNPP